jgi:hypothetical protein
MTIMITALGNENTWQKRLIPPSEIQFLLSDATPTSWAITEFDSVGNVLNEESGQFPNPIEINEGELLTACRAICRFLRRNCRYCTY